MRSNKPLKLSVLDQSPIPEHSTAADALRNTIELASLADRLGYGRYWLAEHHGTPALACNSPEVLIGPVAAATSRIRVGSGGIMLPHYSALKVAENFSMLSILFPDRIDLGIGRAAGTTQVVARALQRDRRQVPPDDFPEQLTDLMNHLGLGVENKAALKQLMGASVPAKPPQVWLLGSSPQSAIWASELGLPYCFADFINPQGAELSQLYARAFQPSRQLAEKWSAVAAWVICAETDEEARELSLSARMMMTQLFRGRLIPVPTVERARKFLEEENVPLEMLTTGRRFITGSPTTVRQSIEHLAEGYGADEVFLVNILHDHTARLRSYELVASAFGLTSDGRQADRAVA